MINFIDEYGKQHAAIVECQKTKGVNGEKSLSGTIYTNDEILEGIGRGWRLQFEDENYCLTYVNPLDEGNRIVVEFDAVHEFFFDLRKSVIYSEMNGSNTANAYLQFIFNGSGYEYRLEVTIPAFEKESFGMKNRLDLFKDFISSTGVEFSVNGKIVRILEKVGTNLSTVVKKGFNLNELRIEKDPGAFITYLRGYGAFVDPDDESKGRLIVEYLSPLADLFGKLEGDPIIDERYTVANNFIERLKGDVENSYGISVDIDMEDLTRAGYDYEQPHEGDYIMAINKDLGFEQKIRIMSYTTSYDTEGNIIDHDVSCGSDNIIQKKINQENEYRKEVQAGLENAISTANQAWMSADGKNKVFQGPDRPTATNKGDIWYQVDGEQTIMNYWNGFDWVPFINPDAVKESVDQAKQAGENAQEAADQAKADAQSAQAKADKIQIDVNGLVSDVTTINGTVNSISSKANEAYNKANAVESRTATLETSVTGLTGRITDVESTTTSTTKKLNELVVTVDGQKQTIATVTTTADSALSKANVIETKVDGVTQTITSIENQLDQIPDGNRNLLLNSSFYTDSEKWGLSSGLNPYFNGQYLRIDKSQTSSTRLTISSGTGWLSGKVQKNKYYSLGIMYYVESVGNAGSSNNIFLRNQLNTGFQDKPLVELDLSITGKWIWISKTDLSWNEDFTLSSFTIALGQTTIAAIRFKEVILVEGRNVKEWSPAPEDLATVSKVNQIATTVDGTIQTISSVKSTADSALAKATQVETTANGLKTTISSVETTANSALTKATQVEATASGLTTTVSEMNTTAINIDWKGRMAGALQLSADPTFLKGSNNLIAYNNTVGGNVLLSRQNVSLSAGGTQPTGSDYRMQIKTIGPSSPGLGGFYYRLDARVNAKFIVRFIANIPANASVMDAKNNIGVGGSTRWLTPRRGTGTWSEYAYLVECGTAGPFSTFGFQYIPTIGTTPSETDPFIWYVAKFEVFDITNSNQSQITQLSDTINLKVSKDDVVNQINISTDGVLIAGNKVQITGQTYIEDGVIGRAQIANLAVSTAQIADAAITDAKIGSLSATKITTGTLNASNVNIINLNANSITTGTISGTNLSINLATGEVIFNKGIIKNLDDTFQMNITTGVTSSRGEYVSPNGTGNTLAAGYNLMNGKIEFYAGTFGETSVPYGGLDTETHSGQYYSGSSWQRGEWSGSRPAIALKMASAEPTIWQSRSRAVVLSSSDYLEPAQTYITGNTYTDGYATGSNPGQQVMVGAGMGVNQTMTEAVDESGGMPSRAWMFGRHGVTIASGYSYESMINGGYKIIPSLSLGTTRVYSGAGDSIKRLAATATLQAGYEVVVRGRNVSMMTGSDGSFAVNSRRTDINTGGGGSATYGGMSFGSDGTGGRVWSMAVYNRTYAAGNGDLCITSAGTLGRKTSARKYKADIKTADDVIAHAKEFLTIQPASWYDKKEYAKGTAVDRFYGFIADEFHEKGLTEVVYYGDKGQVEGLAYDRLTMYQNVILNDHEREIQSLKNEVDQLKIKVKELEAA